MRLRDFLFTLLLPAGFLGGGLWAQRPEITRVANAEGKPGLLPRVFFPPGISREVWLLFPSRADASAAARSLSFVGTFRGRVVFAEESDVELERLCKTYPFLMLCFGSFSLALSCQVLPVALGCSMGG